MIAVYVLLAWYTQQNTRRIGINTERIDQERIISRYNDCLANGEILQKYNAQQERLAAVERKDPNGRKDRIRIYERGIVPIPDCSQLQKPD
jgi:hypothetical protein